jgi:hypothetical protein
LSNFAHQLNALQGTEKEHGMKIWEEKQLYNIVSFETDDGRRIDVVSNGKDSYYVGFNLPTIELEDSTLYRDLQLTRMPRTTVMGPFTDYKLSVLSAKAFYLKDQEAINLFNDHTRDIVRRAVNMIWECYNTDQRYAIDLSIKLGVPQHKKMTRTLTQTSNN